VAALLAELEADQGSGSRQPSVAGGEGGGRWIEASPPDAVEAAVPRLSRAAVSDLILEEVEFVGRVEPPGPAAGAETLAAAEDLLLVARRRLAALLHRQRELLQHELDQAYAAYQAKDEPLWEEEQRLRGRSTVVVTGPTGAYVDSPSQELERVLQQRAALAAEHERVAEALREREEGRRQEALRVRARAEALVWDLRRRRWALEGR
jgi:hypothetical protein